MSILPPRLRYWKLLLLLLSPLSLLRLDEYSLAASLSELESDDDGDEGVGEALFLPIFSSSLPLRPSLHFWTPSSRTGGDILLSLLDNKSLSWEFWVAVSLDFVATGSSSSPFIACSCCSRSCDRCLFHATRFMANKSRPLLPPPSRFSVEDEDAAAADAALLSFFFLLLLFPLFFLLEGEAEPSDLALRSIFFPPFLCSPPLRLFRKIARMFALSTDGAGDSSVSSLASVPSWRLCGVCCCS
mmetsp:Transcript_12218/g.20261  ORF Transcript_12218/g.20261 Transcript_12218/m.20261 type:complete len:243 (-) Transcript_12218:34-762(-)